MKKMRGTKEIKMNNGIKEESKEWTYFSRNGETKY